MPRIVLMLAMLLLVSGPAQAQKKGLFYGLMYGGTQYEETGYKLNMATLTGRLGYNLNSFIGIEGRLAYGDTATSNGVSMTTNWLGSGLIKMSLETMERVYLTVYVGYSSLDATVESGGLEAPFKDEGASAGVSLDLYADSNRGLNIEWVRYLDETLPGSEYTLDHVGIGYFTRF